MTPPFSELCRIAREQHGVTQSEVARRMGLARSTVAALELRGRPVCEDTLRAYAKALGVDPLAMLCEAADVHDGVVGEADEGEW